MSRRLPISLFECISEMSVGRVDALIAASSSFFFEPSACAVTYVPEPKKSAFAHFAECFYYGGVLEDGADDFSDAEAFDSTSECPIIGLCASGCEEQLRSRDAQHRGYLSSRLLDSYSESLPMPVY